MLSYHNDQSIKERYVARFDAHRRADEVIQGTAFAAGKGCFVGCTLDGYDHSLFPIELGWPEWLAYLADDIFEGLAAEDAPQFGTDLLDAVPVGVDLEPVRHLMAIRRLGRVRAGVEELPEADYIPAVLSAIDGVIKLHEAEAAGISRTEADWQSVGSAARSATGRSAEWAERSAGSAAGSAEWAARSAAMSAAGSAARSAARSAWSAARSARLAWSAAGSAKSAAISAELAAGSSAWVVAWETERDDLLEILRGSAKPEKAA